MDRKKLNQREIASLIVCFCISLFLATLVFLLLNWKPAAQAAAGPVGEICEIAEVVVAANLPPEETDEAEPEQDPDPAPPPSLATSQEGESNDQSTEEPDEPQEPETSEDMQEPEDEPQAPSESAVPVNSAEEKESESAPQETEPEEATASDEKMNLEGQIPPLQYVGDLALLAKEYPRMEMAWILDREPGGEAPPSVLAEIVMDKDGETHWRNFRLQKQSDYYSDTTTWYVVTERVHVAERRSLKLGRDTSRFRQAAEQARVGNPPPSRIKWGHYRHMSEAFELARAVTAFQAASKEGKIEYHPDRQDYLQIEWTADKNQEPTIGKVTFCPEGSAGIPIPVPPSS